jgi:hypothetical protein
MWAPVSSPELIERRPTLGHFWAVLAVVKCSLCITILPVLCVGAVIFMLRILADLLTERESLSPGAVRVYFAKFDPVKRPGELIIMNSKNYVHNSNYMELMRTEWSNARVH